MKTKIPSKFLVTATILTGLFLSMNVMAQGTPVGAQDLIKNVDLRKIKDVHWPPADPDPTFRKKLLELNDLAKQKEMVKKACWDFVKKYDEYVQQKYNLKNMGDQYSIFCQVYGLSVDAAKDVESSPLFDMPNIPLLSKLDQITLNIHTASMTKNIMMESAKEAAAGGAAGAGAVGGPPPEILQKVNDAQKRFEELASGYNGSLFGMMGISQPQSFLIAQILNLLSLIVSLFLLVKHFT